MVIDPHDVGDFLSRGRKAQAAIDELGFGNVPRTFANVRILAVAAHKGGVGKTTTAMALAAGLARDGDTVLLVDLDPQGQSTVALNVDYDPTRTVRELLEEEGAARPLAEVSYQTTVPRLELVPATLKLERLAQGLYGRRLREGVLRRALAAARHDWVVIDCRPALDVLVDNALVAATHVLVPCTAGAFAELGIADLLDALAKLNPSASTPAHCRLLITMRDGTERITNALLEQAIDEGGYRERVLATVIPQCADVNHAAAAKQDVFTYAARSTGAVAYGQLVDEVTALWTVANSRR